MVIINNFSFDDKNLDYLCKSKTLIRFLLLSSYSTYYDIRKLSLDILGNLCKKVSRLKKTNFFLIFQRYFNFFGIKDKSSYIQRNRNKKHFQKDSDPRRIQRPLRNHSRSRDLDEALRVVQSQRSHHQIESERKVLRGDQSAAHRPGSSSVDLFARVSLRTEPVQWRLCLCATAEFVQVDNL